MKKQKFPRGSKVRVTDNMPKSMFHFNKGFDAIIEYSYAQQYGSDDVDNYCIIGVNELDEPNGLGGSWYPEETLTLISDDTDYGKKIIDKFRYSKYE